MRSFGKVIPFLVIVVMLAAASVRSYGGFTTPAPTSDFITTSGQENSGFNFNGQHGSVIARLDKLEKIVADLATKFQRMNNEAPSNALNHGLTSSTDNNDPPPPYSEIDTNRRRSLPPCNPNHGRVPTTYPFRLW